ncbi:hypothetical protein RP20_CCG011440 [Aedes albopictus]|nr:hypothetical protein RP20_CCG011440 [Aedes albopictus]
MMIAENTLKKATDDDDDESKSNPKSSERAAEPRGKMKEERSTAPRRRFSNVHTRPAICMRAPARVPMLLRPTAPHDLHTFYAAPAEPLSRTTTTTTNRSTSINTKRATQETRFACCRDSDCLVGVGVR